MALNQVLPSVSKRKGCGEGTPHLCTSPPTHVFHCQLLDFKVSIGDYRESGDHHGVRLKGSTRQFREVLLTLFLFNHTRDATGPFHFKITQNTHIAKQVYELYKPAGCSILLHHYCPFFLPYSSLSPLTCTLTLPLTPPPTYLASFNAFCQHDNILDSILPNHPPECGKSILSRPWKESCYGEVITWYNVRALP